MRLHEILKQVCCFSLESMYVLSLKREISNVRSLLCVRAEAVLTFKGVQTSSSRCGQETEEKVEARIGAAKSERSAKIAAAKAGTHISHRSHAENESHVENEDAAQELAKRLFCQGHAIAQNQIISQSIRVVTVVASPDGGCS
eukprot:2047030-Amphidinium_carterae.1